MVRSHRSADLFIPAAPSKKQEQKRAKSKLGQVADFTVEQLEGRLLLASTPIVLNGNNPAKNSFTFINEDGNNQVVEALGNIQAAIVGANVDGYNNLTLEDLPGTLNGVAVNGGPQIPTAVTKGPTITTVLPDGAHPLPPPALALDSTQPSNSPIYGLDVVPVTNNGVTSANVFVLAIDRTTGNVTVVAEISQQILAAAGDQTGTVSAIAAACFAPAGGGEQLFFVATVVPAASTGATSIQKLCSVNVYLPSQMLIQSSVQGVLGTFGNPTGSITAIAFDSIQGNNLAYAIGKVVTLTSFANTNVVLGQITTTTANTIVGLTVATDPVSGVVYLYAIDDDNVYTIYSVPPPQGIGYGAVTDDYGPLGISTPGNLVYDPNSMIAYTDDLTGGTLDTVTLANRTRSLSIFQLYISESDSTGEIITYINDALGFPDPYSAGLAGGVTISNSNNVLVTIATPSESGDALIGARTRLIPGAPALTGYVPEASAPVNSSSSFGPANYTVGTVLAPGIVSAAGTNIGEIMIGGPVMGAVNLGGSVNLFYADWLLTGAIDGDSPDDLADPNNFYVAGDVGSLIVLTDIGEDDAGNSIPTFPDAGDYLTGFDMNVGGTIQEVRAYGSIYGNVSAMQSPTAPSLGGDILQTEVDPNYEEDPLHPTVSFANGILADNPLFRNDTFATPQYIGTIPTTTGGVPSGAVISGTLWSDNVNVNYSDYYGLALMAGQTVTVQLTDLGPLALDIGVYNPDGTLIASDYNQVSPTVTAGQPFQFTTDRPGVYRLAVALQGDVQFSLAGLSAIPDLDVPYSISVTGTGDVAVGAEAASADIVGDLGGSSTVAIGDLGAVTAVDNIVADNIDVADGNLRDLDSGTIGVTPGASGFPNPILAVPNGSVGLVSTSSSDLIFDTPTAPAVAPTIGGSFQVVSSAGNLLAELIANGDIGVIRANSISDTAAGFGYSIFEVNAADSTTNPGYIDEIDDNGDFGVAGDGGPHIIVGPQGDAGYLDVQGASYLDSTFGTSGNVATEYQPGESVTLTDDTGATVTITPTGLPGASYPTEATSSGGNPTTGTSVNPALPQLMITALPVEGTPGVEGGGVDIAEVESTGGVTIDAGGASPGQDVHIGQIVTAGIGAPMIQTPGPAITTPTTTATSSSSSGSTSSTSTSGQATYFPAPTSAGPVGRTIAIPEPPEIDPAASTSTPYQIILEGAARLDVYQIRGVDTTNPYDFVPTLVTTPVADYGEIVNNTPGDIVNIFTDSIGLLSSDGQVGLSQNHTGASLEGLAVEDDNFPLIDQTVEVNILGQTTGFLGAAIGTINVPKGIGNFDVLGAVGPTTASILGPVLISNPKSPDVASLYSLTLTSGGVGASGSGENSQAGLYVSGAIGPITSDAVMDIRGSIVSTIGLNGITIKGGSIINATIGNFAPEPPADTEASYSAAYANSAIVGGDGLVTTTDTPITNPVLDLGNVTVDGNGGIIGSDFVATHIGKIQVGGFGIFETSFGALADGTITSIAASGYGLRQVSTEGASVGSIQAVGNGTNLSVSQYSADVQLSEHDAFDSYFGFQPNNLTDIDVYLGTTSAAPQDGETLSGLIEGCSFIGSRDLGGVNAYQIVPYSTATSITPTNFDFGDSIGTFTTRSDITDTEITTGRVKDFAPGGNLSEFTLTVSGAIHALSIKGNLLNSSTIVATGINGNIGTIKVGGNIDGTIRAARNLSSLTVGGNLSGTVTSPQIGKLKIGGSINGGNLVINGNVGTFQTTGDLALPGEVVTVNGNLSALKIGGNLNVNMTVSGNLGTLQVSKSVLSGTTTTVGGTLNSLLVDGDVQSGATITAATIHRKKVKGLLQGVVS